MGSILEKNCTEIIPFQNVSELINNEFIEKISNEVEEAIIYHRIFQATGSNKIVNDLLQKRGWLEFIPQNNIPNNAPVQRPYYQSVTLFVQQIPNKLSFETNQKYLQRCTHLLRTCLICPKHVTLHIFADAPNVEDYFRLPEETYINYIIKSSFYVELCMLEKPIDKHQSYFPRTYVTSYYDQWQKFIENFRTTACISFLKTFIKTAFENGPDSLQSTFGLVPWYSLTFAMEQCENYIHENQESNGNATEQVWLRFLKNHHLFVHDQKKFVKSKSIDILAKLEEAKHVIAQISKVWPQYCIDGTKNMWIFKSMADPKSPTTIVNNYNEIVAIIGSESYKNSQHMTIQKFIENKFLIRNDQFHICQWFLVTSVEPLIIWMYRDFYVELLGTKSGEGYERSIWNSSNFYSYLSSLNMAEVWHSVIYPNMREAIKEMMIACLPNMTHRERSFELFEARFVLSASCKPWMVDIRRKTEKDFQRLNDTNVITSVYSKCWEDILKVVFDRIDNPIADTGQFDLICRHYPPKSSPKVSPVSTKSTPRNIPRYSIPNMHRSSDASSKYEKLSLKSIYQKYVLRNASPTLAYLDEKSKKSWHKLVTPRRILECTSFQKKVPIKHYFPRMNMQKIIVNPSEEIKKIIEFAAKSNTKIWDTDKKISLVYTGKDVETDLSKITDQPTSTAKMMKPIETASRKIQKTFKIPTKYSRKPNINPTGTTGKFVDKQQRPQYSSMKKINITIPGANCVKPELVMEKRAVDNLAKSIKGSGMKTNYLKIPEKLKNVPNSRFVEEYLQKGYNVEWDRLPKIFEID